MDDSANCVVVVGKSDPPVYAACVLLATTKLDVNGAVRRAPRHPQGQLRPELMPSRP